MQKRRISCRDSQDACRIVLGVDGSVQNMRAKCLGNAKWEAELGLIVFLAGLPLMFTPIYYVGVCCVVVGVFLEILAIMGYWRSRDLAKIVRNLERIAHALGRDQDKNPVDTSFSG